MAAGLGYKEFTTGDVLTAADANGYLASQVVMVFASAAARTSAIASPQEGMISYLKDTNSTEYYSGSAWTAIGGGSSGAVLQVVSASASTAVATSSNVYSDITGVTATITPTSASNKILVSVVIGSVFKTSSDTSAGFKLFRGATEIAVADTIGYTASTGSIIFQVPIERLDSPATTSATTYKVQFRSTSNTGTVTAMFGSPTNASSITLMEVTP